MLCQGRLQICLWSIRKVHWEEGGERGEGRGKKEGEEREEGGREVSSGHCKFILNVHNDMQKNNISFYDTCTCI